MTKAQIKKGYIALMATIVISLVLLVMTVEEGSSGWYARFNILGTEAKEQASALAEGCAEQAQASLLTDPSYQGNISVTTAAGTCKILPIQYNTLNGIPKPGYVTVQTQAVVRNSYANLEMAMNANDIHLNAIPAAPNSGTVFVTTHIINDNGGTKTAVADVTVTTSATSPVPASAAGTESGSIVTMLPGSFIITSNGLAGYNVTSVGCNSSVAKGEVKFCTITYDDYTTTLTVIANVKNDNGGTVAPKDITLAIDGVSATIGQAIPVTSGSHTVTATLPTLPPGVTYSASNWGYDCPTNGIITLTAGQNKTCVINFDDDPPPAPSCADTVMILDRTGSLSSTDLTGERNAANALVNLYAGVLPPATLPKIGIGSIGAYPNASLPAGAAGVPILGQLTTTYSNILSTIFTAPNLGITGSNSGVGSDLSAGINAATAELNSSRHVAGKQKVLILVSDGDPNQPSGSTPYDTSFLSPTANSQNASGEFWSNPIGAYADAGTDANDPVSENDRHQFYKFGFGGAGGPGLPTGSTVTGIEASVDAWATAGVTNTPENSTKSPTSASSPNQWSSPNSAYVSDNIYATDSTSGHVQGYSNFGFAIPSNATITGIQVTTEAKISGGTPITTGTLYPNGQGNYTSWTGGESGIDETGTVNCTSSNEYITSTGTNTRESVLLDLSSIPNGSTITDVTISVYDRGDTSSGGTYRTFARLNGSDTDASGNALTASGTSSCNLKTQSINLPDTIKSPGTTMEVGVVKVFGNNNAVRVGAIRATITYTPATTGSIGVTLSSNNGNTFTASKNVNVTTTETVLSPSGNSSSDMWSRSWAPADFNNGNFVVHLQNNSTTGATLSTDQLTVNIFYTVPTSTGSACQLGMDLSWNGGASWTTEKIQNITGTATTYTLGAANDDWSGSHTWQPSEFSDANFRARIHAIDPGSNCDNAAVDHVDWLQLKVHYSQNVDPIQAALNAADSAKTSGIDIFTIHFGGDPGPYAGKKLLANLASGNTAVSYQGVNHQNGSLSDGTGGTQIDAGPLSPTATIAPNQFTNPTRAYVSDNSYATDNTNGHQQGYTNFGLTVPPSATVNGVGVEVEAKSSDSSGCQVGVELSTDNGATFTTTNTLANITGSDVIYNLGGTASLWGRSWTPADFSNGKFVVRLQNIDPGNNCVNNSTLSIDRVRVHVYNTSANTENSDNDNFFVAPTSADMQGIFNYIGEQVCPAALNVAATPPPTTATIIVNTNTVIDSGQSLPPTGFPAKVTNATNPSITSFNAIDATPVTITVDPGGYKITEDTNTLFQQTAGAMCTADSVTNPIAAGETRVCVLDNNDRSAPPTPPNLNLNTNTWQETPN